MSKDDDWENRGSGSTACFDRKWRLFCNSQSSTSPRKTAPLLLSQSIRFVVWYPNQLSPSFSLTDSDINPFSWIGNYAQACLDYGFFYLINHGVEDELIERVFDESRKFFSLPIEEKMKLARKEHRGYTALYAEKLDPTASTDIGFCSILIWNLWISSVYLVKFGRNLNCESCVNGSSAWLLLRASECCMKWSKKTN